MNHTTKSQWDPKRGRRCFLTCDYESYAELYFSPIEPEDTYGNVTVRENTFISGPNASHAITLAKGGRSLRVESKDATSGGPFTIGRVIHSSRGFGFPGWIGGVAVFYRTFSETELNRLAELRHGPTN